MYYFIFTKIEWNRKRNLKTLINSCDCYYENKGVENDGAKN